MPPIRSFIAFDISGAQRAAAAELQQNLQKGIQFTKSYVRWVAPEAMHLTLKFLGDLEQAQVEEVARLAEAALAGTPRFSFRLKGLGVFPNLREPKVLWCGVGAGAREMSAIQKRIEDALDGMGFKPERQPFRPHLTLGRIPALRGVEAMLSVVKSHQEADLGEAPLSAVTLYQSTLTPDGPIYTPQRQWELKPLEASRESKAPRASDASPEPSAPQEPGESAHVENI